MSYIGTTHNKRTTNEVRIWIRYRNEVMIGNSRVMYYMRKRIVLKAKKVEIF
ncbi:hypothetical protein HYD77_03680 [Mycoplasmopsis bovis]|nr:hypothetical protein HYD77_03680 [Mycoplasmopsis bovis]